MFDLRPIGYVIGLLIAILGATMILPMLVDLAEGRGHWSVFLESSVITMLSGGLIALSCSNGLRAGLNIPETILLTTGVWVVLPLFGALPLMLGESELGLLDAYFEAMSGLTTTGSTVITGLDDMARGILLWRGILQWLGGIGIVVMAMVFLPELRVGGMQIFRAEAFDTMGKILPRATEIAAQISVIYIFLTLACMLCYVLIGMSFFDATVHSFTTISTGGFSNYDVSFGRFTGPAEYVAVLFMILAVLPFVRYVQLVNGNGRPLLRDSQVRVFVGMLAVLVAVVVFALMRSRSHPFEQALRESLFNLTSIITGTGYASADYMRWGPFFIALFFFVALIGGCAGSTTCSIKIFRYQLLFSSIRVQLQRIRTPHGLFTPRYEGKPVPPETLNSVMVFFVFFFVSLGLFSVALSLTGLDFVTALSGAATAMTNTGPGLGQLIGPSGNFAGLNDSAKWILILAMLVGRLELMTVYVMLTPAFWRA
ncbi:TrkH family potassium uptake protein [Pontibaca methylaminivorans]|uniref:TrkH family potassium uptake protein n=1 Tax=Pontibaca methylaminivorans TaxID=515897 RepID=UPI002FDAC38A